MKTDIHALLNALNTDLKCVQVIFKNTNGGYTPGSKAYTYKTEIDLKVGDLVVVESPHSSFTVAKVVGTDSSKLLSYKLAWIVQKVDVESHRLNVDQEQTQFDNYIRLSAKKRQQDAIKELKLSLGMDAEFDDKSLLEALVDDAATDLALSL